VSRKLAAEFLGTAWLVFGGCGSAVLGAQFLGDIPGIGNLGIGHIGVALAFGLTVLTGAYAVGHLSGAHFNPAVTIGLATAGRFPASSVPGYIIAQVLGAAAGANGYGDHSPGHFSLAAAAVSEFSLTFFFLVVILGATARRAPLGFAGIPIGLALTLIHLISIPVTNTSVNPARSTSQALFVQGWAFDQLWLFWLAPIAGAVLAGLVGAWLDADDPQSARVALSDHE